MSLQYKHWHLWRPSSPFQFAWNMFQRQTERDCDVSASGTNILSKDVSPEWTASRDDRVSKVRIKILVVCSTLTDKRVYFLKQNCLDLYWRLTALSLVGAKFYTCFKTSIVLVRFVANNVTLGQAYLRLLYNKLFHTIRSHTTPMCNSIFLNCTVVLCVTVLCGINS